MRCERRRRSTRKQTPSATSFPFPHRSRRASTGRVLFRAPRVSKSDHWLAVITFVGAAIGTHELAGRGDDLSTYVAFLLSLIAIGSFVWVWRTWGK
jgi:hypothetical protein